MTLFASGYPAAAHTFASELDDDVALDGASGHHLSRVRRPREGEVVTVADGNGRWRPYTIARARRGAIDLHARGELVIEPVLEPGLTVAFALTKTRLVPNFDTALSVTTILADYLAGTR